MEMEKYCSSRKLYREKWKVFSLWDGTRSTRKKAKIKNG